MALPRDRKSARHRAVNPDPPAPRSSADDVAAEDGELYSYLAALAPTAGPQTEDATGRFGTAQVFQLRLSALRTEQLRRISEERGVSAGSLVVDWVTERLDHEDTPTGPLAVVADAEKRRRGPLGRLGRRS